MKIIEDIPLSEFNWWGGAQGRANKLTDEQMQQLEQYLEQEYPEGIDATELNDMMWFNFDEICNMLGINGESDDEDESLYENKTRKKNLKEISSGMLYRAAKSAKNQGRSYQHDKFSQEAIYQNIGQFCDKYGELYLNLDLDIRLLYQNYLDHGKCYILVIGFNDVQDNHIFYSITYYDRGLHFHKSFDDSSSRKSWNSSVDEFKKDINAQKTPIRRNVLSAFADYVSIISDYNNNYLTDDEVEPLNESNTQKITKKQLQEMVRKCAVKVLNEAMKNSK